MCSHTPFLPGGSGRRKQYSNNGRNWCRPASKRCRWSAPAGRGDRRSYKPSHCRALFWRSSACGHHTYNRSNTPFGPVCLPGAAIHSAAVQNRHNNSGFAKQSPPKLGRLCIIVLACAKGLLIKRIINPSLMRLG
jgi:hypothetical protein